MSNQFNPFPAEQQQVLSSLLNNATTDQLFWLSGYLSGLSQAKSQVIPSKEIQQQLAGSDRSILTILYGTHTGHSEELANKLAEKAGNKGIPCKISSLDDYKVRDLNKVENLALIVSTHGEGEPPLMAEDLHEFVQSGKAKLDKLNYAILALGDRSYKRFCQTGIDFDVTFKKFGGTEILPLEKCDVDFEVQAAKWINNLVSKYENSEGAIPALQNEEVKPKSKYNKLNPFYAEVLDKRKITGRYSDKEVWHLELSLAGSDLSYEPGDTLGIFPNNPPELVRQILDFKKFPDHTTITTKYDDVTLYEALYHHFEITVLNRKVLQDYNELVNAKPLNKLLKHEDQLEEYLYGHDLLDLLQDFPSDINAHQLVGILRYLPPRMYSISSSLNANPEEVHITVAKVDFELRSRSRKGACSTFISDRLEDNWKVPVFIEKNINFRLPKEANTPLIMIGAGTGVAPYRSFLQDLEEKGSGNNSWLFFGDRTFNEDFLYQIEWQKYLQNGVLGQLDVAFSRDQVEKVYVQHKLKEKAAEIYDWLQKGAHIYICGDRRNMFSDVQNTLLEIIKTQSGVSLEKAEEYLHQLKREKRYQTDVY
ncbi:MAG: assimilatory sulfite reductase (NADPH) flavoprotein subunit [Prolixibacteraceae bacterium]